MAGDDLNSTFDASNEEQVKERQLSAKRREKENTEVIVQLLSTPMGRNWMHGMLSFCEIFSAIPPSDEATTNQRLGQRNVGLKLWAECERAGPELLIRMLREKGNGHG